MNFHDSLYDLNTCGPSYLKTVCFQFCFFTLEKVDRRVKNICEIIIPKLWNIPTANYEKKLNSQQARISIFCSFSSFFYSVSSGNSIVTNDSTYFQKNWARIYPILLMQTVVEMNNIFYLFFTISISKCYILLFSNQ